MTQVVTVRENAFFESVLTCLSNVNTQERRALLEFLGRVAKVRPFTLEVN
jgi:hypothetical protein